MNRSNAGRTQVAAVDDGDDRQKWDMGAMYGAYVPDTPIMRVRWPV